MKTDDLINLLSEDLAPRRDDVSRSILIATVVGGAFSAAVFFAVFGLRSDFSRSLETLRFVFKFVAILTLTGASLGLTLNVISPGRNLRRWELGLAVAPLLLIVAVILELLVVPSQAWGERLVGRNALHCLTIIPLLSIAPATCIIYAMRSGAAENPGLAGLSAALTSAGVAATLYATNCPDDSPLFVATWYPLAVLATAMVGYIAGRRFLRW